MKNILVLIFVGVGLFGCKVESFGQGTSTNMVGAWSSPALTSRDGERVPSSCKGLEISNDGVTMALLKIEPSGRVLSPRRVKNPQSLYQQEGWLDSEGHLKLSANAEEDYLGEMKAFAKKNGMELSYVATLQMTESRDWAGSLEMNIEVTLKQGAVEYKQNLGAMYFIRTDESGEKALLQKMENCLTNY